MTTDNLHLTACLLLYFQRRDEALGLGWQSQRVRGLLWYYNRQRQQVGEQIVTAAYLNGIIQQGRAEIKKLVKLAETAPDKHAIARRVVALKTQIDEAAQQLEAMALPSQKHSEPPDHNLPDHNPAQTSRSTGIRQ